jgi:hypothetical protein
VSEGEYCKYFVHIYVKGKRIPAETIWGMGGGANKGEWWKGWIQVWYIDIL